MGDEILRFLVPLLVLVSTTKLAFLKQLLAGTQSSGEALHLETFASRAPAFKTKVLHFRSFSLSKEESNVKTKKALDIKVHTPKRKPAVLSYTRLRLAEGCVQE